MASADRDQRLEEEYDRLMGVNLKGAYFMCRAALRHMTGRKAGVIVNIASIGGLFAVRDRLAYTVSKHAVVGLTRAMAIDHARDGSKHPLSAPGSGNIRTRRRRTRK